jgi:hypothetical protein
MKFNYTHPISNYALKLSDKLNPTLLANFKKVCKWIKDNCPNLNGKFQCRHNPYYKIHLIVEDGKAYLCEGSHDYGYSTYLSATETAVYTQGSCQSAPYAFHNVYFFRNDRLEEFLSQWQSIKQCIIAKNIVQSNVYSANFNA